MAADTNPYAELDDQPAPVNTAPAAAAPDPYAELEDAPAAEETAGKLQHTVAAADATMPEVVVRGKAGPEASWSDVASGLMPAIGAKIETKIAGAKEAYGNRTEQDAKKKLWQSLILPRAVREARDQNITLTDHPDVVDTAQHLGIRPDTFTRDWPDYVNMTDEELGQHQSEQRGRLQTGQAQMTEGAQRRQMATQVAEESRPNIPERGLKSLAFDTATMIPDLLAGTAATVATGGIGGVAVMGGLIAPEEYATARTRGLDDRHAATYATLSTLASSVPEIPVLKIIENAPLAKRLIGGVVGDKLAGTAAGKIAGTAVTQGVTQSVVQALQTGIDEKMFDEQTPLSEALKRIAWAGVTGAVVGAPMGALHAGMSREPKAAAGSPAEAVRAEPTIGEAGLQEAGAAPSLAEPSQSPAPSLPDKTLQEGKTGASAEEISSPQPLEGQDLHEALKAVQDKSVNPGQVERLEAMGLATRNDVNVPRLLPAGRRELAQSLRARIPAEKEATSPVSQPQAEISPPPAESGKQPAGETVEAKSDQVPNRLRDDQDLREGLTAMKGETGWAQVGGRMMRDATTDQVSGRTSWIPHAEWWPGRPKGLTEPQIHKAVDKAVAGQPLTKRETAMVDFMTSVHDERVALTKTHQELTQDVPELQEQPKPAVDLTLMASRAAEHDGDATMRTIDSWTDDHPDTLARIQGEFEQIIGRGHQRTLEAQAAGSKQPVAPQARSAAARDLFGEDRSQEQALADEQRRRDAARSPNKDVSADIGTRGDLFSRNANAQTDFTDQLKQAREQTNAEPTDGQKSAGNYAKGTLDFAGLKIALENPKGSQRTGTGKDGKTWSRKMHADYGYVKGTKGADGDAIDVFMTGKADTGKVFVIDQVHQGTTTFDEHKAILGAETQEEAEALYHKHYPKGWTGLDHTTELSTKDFAGWVTSRDARRPLRATKRNERRTDTAQRTRVAEMNPEELRKEILTHELTGIPNRRAYVESDKLPTQVSIDVDSLKAVNDLGGHHAGDELLKAVARVLHEETDHAYHLSGDEFAVQALHPREANAIMERAAERLKNAEIIVAMPDGRALSLKGLGVSFGVGEDLAKADTALQAHKKQREAQGTRSPRGEAPRGLTFRPSEEGRQDRGSTGTPEKAVGPKFARRTDVADKTAVEAFADKVKGDLGLEDFTLRALPSGDIDLELLQVPRGERNQGLGTRAMQRLTEWADANGRRVTFALADRGKLKDWGTTSAERLRRFYGQFGFVSNKGRNKDFALSISAHMYREPREPKSRRTEQQTGLPRRQVEGIVQNAVREANLGPGFPHVETHEDTTTLPQHIQDLIGQDGAQETTGAVYDPSTGRIHLIASNNGSEREVRENLWHEAVGHHGLRMAMDGPQYNAVMDGINRDMPERVQAAAQRNGLDTADPAQRRAAAEEVIAYAAGQHLSGQPIDKPVLPYWTRAVRAVKAFFARMAGKPFYDDQAIAGLIQQAHKALREGAAGTVPGETARSTRAPRFYSPVERAVEASKQGKASAEQWLATIKKGAGIKPEELEWLNLEPWLKDHKGPVTKEELSDYIRANRLELQETLHEESGNQTADESMQTRLAEELRAEGHEIAFADDGSLQQINVRDRHSPTGWSLHDPSNAEEFAALPESVRQRVDLLNDISTRVAAQRQERAIAHGDFYKSDTTTTQYGDYTLPGGQNYREMLLRLPDKGGRREVESDYSSAETARQIRERNARRDQESGTYRSSHWQEPNILAHVRFNERTDADGKKVLFLEELQSDWHQAGRKTGYQPRATEQRRAVKAELQQNGQVFATYDQHGQFITNIIHTLAQTPEEALAKANQRLVDQDKYSIAPDRRVPDAPFKTSWPMLTMKRMIRWAAENGHERIAWTTGEQQADRYGLQRHVSGLKWRTTEDGRRIDMPMAERGGFVSFTVGHDGKVLTAASASASGFVDHDLAEVIGQDLSRRVLSEESGELTGQDLKVGGQGMRGFYDDILPRETDKLIKKYGAKVRPTDIGVKNDHQITEQPPGTWVVHHPTDQYDFKEFPSELAAHLYVERLNEQRFSGVHGFDVTPEMRTAALSQGFPLFARRQQPLNLQQPGPRGVYERIRKAVDYLMENPVSRDIRKLVHPAGMSPEAKRVAHIATSALGKLAHETYETQSALEEFSRQIDKTPVEDQLAMIDAMERGEPQPNPELQPVADEMRKLLDQWRDKVRGLGAGYLDKFIENYFPHYWHRGDEAQRLVASIQGRRTMRGPASFLKMRTIPTIKEGMEAGLTPITVNPLVLTMLKTREMQRFVTGVNLLRRLKGDGLAQFVPSSQQVPDGFKEIDDPSARVSSWSDQEGGWIQRGRYVMPEDAARVINNHLSASWAKHFAPATVFRVGANMLNALQLGFSAFHLGFTTLDAIISKTALGVERLAHGEPLKAAAAFGEAATGPGAAVANVRRGYKLLKAYANPIGATPQMLRLVDALEKGGGRVQMDRYYLAAQGASPFHGVGVQSLAKDIHQALTAPTDKLRNTARALGAFPQEYATSLLHSMQQLVQTTHPLGVPFELAGRITRASTSWIMEHVVPLQKLGVFSDLARDHIERNPNQDPNVQAVELQKIWAVVDDRLGEMVYDNLFLNRTFKDMLHFGIRAVGWNWGTWRSLGGAPIDVMKMADKLMTSGRITAQDLGHKIPYAMAMAMTTALYGSIYQYLSTGEGPQELKDYFFPKTGGTTNYGTPQRVSLPSYAKDVYEYSQRPGTTILNKLNPIFNVIGEMWTNEDFFGNPITDPDATAWEATKQRAAFVASEAAPFSLQGRQQIAGSEQPGVGGTIRQTLPYFGITPAPGYVTSPEQMERRERHEREIKYTRDLQYKMKKAYEAGDKATGDEYRDRYVKAQRHLKETESEVKQDRGKAAVQRRKTATSMRQQGLPHTADLVASLPLEPDAAAREYFRQQAQEATA